MEHLTEPFRVPYTEPFPISVVIVFFLFFFFYPVHLGCLVHNNNPYVTK